MPFKYTITGSIILMLMSLVYATTMREEIKMPYKVIKFEAEWCGPCQAMKPVWNELKDQVEGVDFEVVDVDDDPETSSKYNVRSIPTIVFLKDDQVVSSIVGATRLSDLVNEINKIKGVE